MSGQVVTVSHLDSVRIDCGSRAVSIPASLILDIDAVLKHCQMSGDWLHVLQGPDKPIAQCWSAHASHLKGEPAATPWGALSNLARELEKP